MHSKDPWFLEALSKRKAVSQQEKIAHSEDEPNYMLLHDGKHVPKPGPAIMTSKESANAALTSVTIIHDDTKAPRFTGAEGGIDIHTFLCNVDDVITKRRLNN